jgi:hypothetical protein
MSKPTDLTGDDPILERARALPEALNPPTDLWPEVERRMAAPATGRWTPVRLATAAVLLIGVSSMATLWLSNAGDSSRPGELADSSPVSKIGPWLVSGTDIAQTRANLYLTVQDEMASLSPATREVLNANLRSIESAREEINAALEGHPNSELLQHLLVATYTNELTLLSEIGEMARSATRSATASDTASNTEGTTL